MICRKCNHELADSSKFCPKCGTPAVKPDATLAGMKKCPLCGTEYPPSAKFCKLDGQALREVDLPAVPEPRQETIAIGLICPVCGTANPLSAKFCKVDGKALQVTESEFSSGVQNEVGQCTGGYSVPSGSAVDVQRQYSAQDDREPKKGGKKALIWGLLSVLLLGGGGAGGYYFRVFKTCNDAAVPVRVESGPLQGQTGYLEPKHKSDSGTEQAAPAPAERRSLPPEFSRDRVKNLIDTFLDCSNSKNYQILDLYADRVNTFSGKTVVKSVIKKDAENYFNRWRNITFTLIDDFVITDIAESPNKQKVVFRFNYQLENARKSASGISQTVWIVESRDGRLKIVDQKENIISRN